MNTAPTYLPPRTRVLFGPGLRHTVRDEVRGLGCRRALVLATPAQAASAEALRQSLADAAAGVFAGAVMHTPAATTEKAVACLRKVQADCVVAIGGGSTTGLGKAIALRTGVRQIVIPTTYAGSEATPILGQTEDGIKSTITDPRVRPDVILYDPELVTTLPVDMTVTSALNAIAHAAEALYAVNRTEVSDRLARDGMAAFARGLSTVVNTPDNVAAREETLRGAYACGAVLGMVGMALHHKLCHTLGGAFDMPHAQTHAVILPHAIGYNALAASDALTPVTEIFGGVSPGRALFDFAGRMGAPQSLRALGLAEADLDHAADLATQNPYPNPKPITRQGLRTMLQAAWEGRPPPR